MVILQDIPFSLNAETLIERFKIEPDSDCARAFEELLSRVQEAGKPKALYQISYIDEKGSDSVVIGGVRFTSRVLRRNLDPVERVFPYAATCGTEVDSVKEPPGDVQQKIWLYVLKGELLQAAILHMQEHIKHHHQISSFSNMNPGSGDAVVWPIAQQRELFSILGDVENSIGVRLTKSLLMMPEMSVSGIIFPAETDFRSCQVCHRENCPGRRAPFSQELWQSLCED